MNEQQSRVSELAQLLAHEFEKEGSTHAAAAVVWLSAIHLFNNKPIVAQIHAYMQGRYQEAMESVGGAHWPRQAKQHPPATAGLILAVNHETNNFTALLHRLDSYAASLVNFIVAFAILGRVDLVQKVALFTSELADQAQAQVIYESLEEVERRRQEYAAHVAQQKQQGGGASGPTEDFWPDKIGGDE